MDNLRLHLWELLAENLGQKAYGASANSTGLGAT
jgi:hypothetical protein